MNCVQKVNTLKLCQFRGLSLTMIGIRRFLSHNSLLNSAGYLSSRTAVRSVFKLDFDSNEEIVENYFDNTMLIGINLPDNKNILTETAVMKLKNSFRSFEENDEMSCAVICGFGGTFCTGVEPAENTLKESQKLIEVLHKGKKPVVAALNGNVINFGFHLAVMCDIRIMENEAKAGFGSLNQRQYVPEIVYQRLASVIGISRALELILAQGTKPVQYWLQAGFSSNTSCGTALGQAVRIATSIGQKPLKEVIEEKSKVLSILPNKL